MDIRRQFCQLLDKDFSYLQVWTEAETYLFGETETKIQNGCLGDSFEVNLCHFKTKQEVQGHMSCLSPLSFFLMSRDDQTLLKDGNVKKKSRN